ncbi:MAG TPA: hypothetical protein VGM88_14745 [Kofleriaceae bacterium]
MATRETWQRRLGPLYGGAVALVTSTPWRWPPDLASRAEPRSAAWIVALGVPVGASAWLVATLARAAGLPLTVCALLGLAMFALASAALVERGLADRIAAWSSGSSSAPGLSSSPIASRDPAASVAPLLAVLFFVLVRAAAVAALPPGRWLAAFVAMAVAGRWSGALVQALGDPIAGEPAARSLVAAPAPAWLAAALGVGVTALAALAAGKAAIAAVAFAALAAFALGLEAQRRDGGLSSPVVATVAACGELAVLLAATL